MSDDNVPPWEQAKQQRIHIPNPRNDPGENVAPWEQAQKAQAAQTEQQKQDQQYGEADRALAMASRDYALPILGAPGDFAGWLADMPGISETVGTKGLTHALGRDKVPPPKTMAGRVGAETLGQGVSSMVQGGVIGKGISTAGSLLGKGWLEAGGERIAEPLSNLVGGIGSASGGMFGELTKIPGAKTVGSMLGGGVAGAAAGRATGQGGIKDPEVEKLIGVYDRLGLNPTYTSVGLGNRATRWLEGNVLPQTIGGGRIPNTIQNNFKQVVEKQQEIASAYSGGGTRTRFDTGEGLQRSVGEYWQNAKKEAGDVINKIIEKDVPANEWFFAGNLAKTFGNLKGTARTPEGFEATADPVVKTMRELVKENGGYFTGRDLHAHFGMLGRKLDEALAAGADNAQVAQLRKAVGQDLDEAIKSLPNKQVHEDWQWAKANYANAMMDYRQAFEKLLGTKQVPVAPERVYDILLNTGKEQSGANIKMFDTVWRALGKEQRGDLAATVLARMGQRDKDPTQFGNLENWSLGNFLKEYATLTPEAKGMLFQQNAKQAKVLDDLVDAAKSLKSLEKLASTSRSGTAAVQIGQVSSAATAAMTGGIGTGALSILGGIGGPAAAAWVLTNPSAVKMAAQGLRDMEKGLQTASSAFIALNVLKQPAEPPPEQRPGYQRAMSRPPAAQVPQFAGMVDAAGGGGANEPRTSKFDPAPKSENIEDRRSWTPPHSIERHKNSTWDQLIRPQAPLEAYAADREPMAQALGINDIGKQSYDPRKFPREGQEHATTVSVTDRKRGEDELRRQMEDERKRRDRKSSR